jgi:hypothetical protein
VGGARFQPFGEAPQAVWGFIRAHRFLPPLIPHLRLRLKVCLPGVVRVPVKLIVVYGKLRELIPDVSRLPRFAPVQGRGGMGLGGGVRSDQPEAQVFQDGLYKTITSYALKRLGLRRRGVLKRALIQKDNRV